MSIKVKHIYGNTWCLRTPLALLPFYKLNDREVVLMDSGSDPNGSVAEYFAEQNMKVRDLLLSHAHFDHIGGAKKLRKRFDTKVYISAAEKGETIPVFGEPDYEEAAEIRQSRESYRCRPNFKIPETSRFLQIEEAEFEVIFAPGHSEGHTVFVTPDGVCYLGDLVSSSNFLSAARMLYIKDLALDRESKMRLRERKFSFCVAAHKKIFPGTELASVIDQNLDYIGGLRKQIQEAVSGAGSDIYREILAKMGFVQSNPVDDHVLLCSIESFLKEID